MQEISVKLYFTNSSDVRRFPLGVPVSQNGGIDHRGIYGALFERVKQYCPADLASRVKIAWKDDDGDMVIMSSDEEVKEAMRHMNGDVFRVFARFVDGEKGEKPAVFVNIGDESAAMDETQSGQEKTKNNTEEKSIHSNVICDGCDRETMEGARFKCLICHDYDLCSTCETKHVHDIHPMIRIASPTDHSWMPAYMAMQAFNLPHARFMRRDRGHSGCPFFNGRERSDGKEQGNSSTGGQQQQSQQQGMAHGGPGFQILRDIGETVAAVLNGFGIDVDVDVEHGADRTKVTPPKGETQNNTNVEKKQDAKTNVAMDQGPVEKEQNSSQVTLEPAVDQSKDKVAPAPAVENMETSPGEQATADWMILDKADAQQQETQVGQATQPKQASLAPAPATVAASSVPSPSAPVAPSPAAMNPKVEEALACMMAMGFTNDGGWLTQVLEAKNGDIAAVLEILHPQGQK